MIQKISIKNIIIPKNLGIIPKKVYNQKKTFQRKNNPKAVDYKNMNWISKN